MKRTSHLLTLALAFCTGCLSLPEAGKYDDAQQVCVLSDQSIDESSGLELSASNSAVFWTHNDDVGDDRLFAFDLTGATVGVHRLNVPEIEDWEDLSAFQLDGEEYVLCADTGDNYKKRSQLSLYIVKEPDSADGEGELTVVSRISFRYEDGRHDCEGVAVDVSSNRILLATKERDSKASALYELPLNILSDPTVKTAKKIGPLGIADISSMDVSTDGQRAVILAYEDVFEVRRRRGQSWANAIESGPAKIAELPLGQWEAVCYSHDDQAIFVTREKLPTLLLKVPSLLP